MSETKRGPALRLPAKAASLDALHLTIEDRAPALPEGWALIEVAAAPVNPSDVKACLGIMPQAVYPRTPGRDHAGTVVAGPAALLGREVWGSAGDVGITRDGSHARYLALPAAAVREKPANLSMAEAAGVGVPFVTAWEGLASAGGVKPGDVVLVLGGNGKVGEAAIQIATAAGARVFAAMRRAEPYRGHASGPVRVIDSSTEDVAAVVRAETGGHGADIVYNTVGSPYFTAGCAAMGHDARQIFISTVDRAVPFDIFLFYRGRHRFLGCDSLSLDAVACAPILDALRPGFESGKLRPFPPAARFPLAEAEAAYRLVLSGTKDRVVLEPGR